MWMYLRSAWQCNQTLRYQAKSDYRWRFSQETATKTRVRTSPKTWLEPPWFRTMALQFVCASSYRCRSQTQARDRTGTGPGRGAPRREPEGAPGEKGERGAQAPQRRRGGRDPPRAGAPGDSEPAPGGGEERKGGPGTGATTKEKQLESLWLHNYPRSPITSFTL